MRRVLNLTAWFTLLVVCNASLERRAIVRPIRPGHDEPDNPSTNPDHPYSSINGEDPNTTGGYTGEVQSSAYGTASGATNPCKSGDGELCEHLIEVAMDVVSELIQNAVQGGASTSTSPAPYPTGPSTVGGSNQTTSNQTTTAALPNFNVSSEMDLGQYYDMFTSDEFDMYRENRPCFYANLEREYVSAASAASSTAATNTVTAAPERRTPQLGPLESAMNSQDPAEQSSIQSEQSSLSAESKVSTLYLDVLPSQLSSIYNQAPPTSLTVTATSTGTCQGLDNSSSFVTSWAVYGYRPGFSPSPTASSPAATSPSTGMASPRKAPFALVLGALLAWITFVV